MIYELKTEDFMKEIVKKIEELNKEVVLQNPNTSSKFPCYVVQTVLIQDKLTEDGIPIKQRLQISIEQWASKKYDVLKMLDQVKTKLRDLNLTITNTSLDTFDEVTKKYRLVTSYEVNYNGLYNSLELVR